MKLEFREVAFEHWPECIAVSNGCIELVVPRTFGPRIVKCGISGGPNLFKIFPDEGAGVRVRGGHRLWVAPERREVTWVTDNDPVDLTCTEDSLRVTGTVESDTGLQKEIIIRFEPDPRSVLVAHRIVNRNPWAIELAPWALTQTAPGGIALCGFPPRGRHPEMLLPTNPLVMWAYTKLGDSRWTWGEQFFALRQDPEAAEPQKIGLFNEHSWMAYLLGAEVFFKWTNADPAKTYPDFGCSIEIFTNRFMMELETLGPMEKIQPGESIEHTEHWILLNGVRLPEVSDGHIAAALRPVLDRILPPQRERNS